MKKLVLLLALLFAGEVYGVTCPTFAAGSLTYISDLNTLSAGCTPTGGAPADQPMVVAAAGTVDAITATYSPAITLTDKTLVAFVSSGANATTTPSFTPNGLTTRTITGRGGQALRAGDIGPAGFVALVEYNLANTRWELLNPVGANLGTPTGGILTNTTGLPVSTGISGLGTGVATLLGGTSNGTGGPAGTASPTFTGTVTLPVLVGSDTTDSTSSTTGAFKTAGGLGVAKALSVGTNIGVNAAPAGSGSIYIGGTTPVAGAQAGVYANATGTNLGSTRLVGFQSLMTTAAAAYTVANASGFLAFDFGLGSTSAITDQRGFYALDQTKGSTSNSGFQSDVTSGTGKYAFRASGTAVSYFNGGIERNVATITASTYTVATTDTWLIVNFNGTCTITLPTASSFTGRELYVKSILNNATVISNASNVKPLATDTAGTAILAAQAGGGKWATLVSDGTNWIIMQAN